MIAADIPTKNDNWKMILPVESYSWFNFWDDRNTFIYISKSGVKLLDKDIAAPEKVTIPQENIRKYIG